MVDHRKLSLVFGASAILYFLIVAGLMRIPTDTVVGTVTSIIPTNEGCAASYVYGNNQSCTTSITENFNCQQHVGATVVLALDGNDYSHLMDWYADQWAVKLVYCGGLLLLCVSMVASYRANNQPVEPLPSYEQLEKTETV